MKAKPGARSRRMRGHSESSVRTPSVRDAMREGRVLVYGVVEPDEFAGWEEAFEAKYPGIEVEFKRKYVPGTPPPMATEIMEEAKSGGETADAVIVSVPPLLQFRDLDLLAGTRSREAAAYPRSVRDPGDPWFPIASIPMVQVYNPQLVSEPGLPRGALDLTSPRWRGSIATHDPSLGTVGAYWLASLRPVLGEAKWRDFVEGLARNKPRAFPLYDPVVDSVADGETSVGLTVLLHDYVKAKRAGRAIERLKLSDVPLMTTFNAVARTRDGSHPAAAALLIEFLLSEEGQRLIGSTYLRIPARPGSSAPYSLERVLPTGERPVRYPNAAMARTARDSLSLMARLFARE